MEEVMTLIENAVTAGGGKISWESMLAAVPEKKQRFIKAAMIQLKADGKIIAQVDGTVTPPTFFVQKMTG